MSTKQALHECEKRMEKSLEYFEKELHGIRTGRATTALIEYIKVSYYGNPTDLREMAAISVPEPTQLLIKPFDPTSKSEIVKALETADLGLNPLTDDNGIRINVPPPSTERRQQLVGQVKKMAEESKISLRNERRDANKQIDHLVKDKSNRVSEDQGHDAKHEIDELTKKHIEKVDGICNKKAAEIEEI